MVDIPDLCACCGSPTEYVASDGNGKGHSRLRPSRRYCPRHHRVPRSYSGVLSRLELAAEQLAAQRNESEPLRFGGSDLRDLACNVVEVGLKLRQLALWLDHLSGTNQAEIAASVGCSRDLVRSTVLRVEEAISRTADTTGIGRTVLRDLLIMLALSECGGRYRHVWREITEGLDDDSVSVAWELIRTGTGARVRTHRALVPLARSSLTTLIQPQALLFHEGLPDMAFDVSSTLERLATPGPVPREWRQVLAAHQHIALWGWRNTAIHEAALSLYSGLLALERAIAAEHAAGSLRVTLRTGSCEFCGAPSRATVNRGNPSYVAATGDDRRCSDHRRIRRPPAWSVDVARLEEQLLDRVRGLEASWTTDADVALPDRRTVLKKYSDEVQRWQRASDLFGRLQLRRPRDPLRPNSRQKAVDKAARVMQQSMEAIWKLGVEVEPYQVRRLAYAVAHPEHPISGRDLAVGLARRASTPLSMARTASALGISRQALSKAATVNPHRFDQAVAQFNEALIDAVKAQPNSPEFAQARAEIQIETLREAALRVIVPNSVFKLLSVSTQWRAWRESNPQPRT